MGGFKFLDNIIIPLLHQGYTWSLAWGATRILVLHTCATRETRKKGCFLRLIVILENHDQGSKCAYFQEKWSFLDSIRDVKGSFFQMLPKKSCLGGKIGCKNCMKFLFGSVFLERANLDQVYFENLWSRMCTTLVFEQPPGVVRER